MIHRSLGESMVIEATDSYNAKVNALISCGYRVQVGNFVVGFVAYCIHNDNESFFVEGSTIEEAATNALDELGYIVMGDITLEK